MRILIETIEYDKQRYDTTDDWTIDHNGNIHMYVSDNVSKKEVYKETIHGLLECLLCDLHGITQKQVDDYDLAHPESDNPGENEDAPYHKEHRAANVAETLIDL